MPFPFPDLPDPCRVCLSVFLPIDDLTSWSAVQHRNRSALEWWLKSVSPSPMFHSISDVCRLRGCEVCRPYLHSLLWLLAIPVATAGVLLVNRGALCHLAAVAAVRGFAVTAQGPSGPPTLFSVPIEELEDSDELQDGRASVFSDPSVLRQYVAGLGLLQPPSVFHPEETCQVWKPHGIRLLCPPTNPDALVGVVYHVFASVFLKSPDGGRFLCPPPPLHRLQETLLFLLYHNPLLHARSLVRLTHLWDAARSLDSEGVADSPVFWQLVGFLLRLLPPHPRWLGRAFGGIACMGSVIRLLKMLFQDTSMTCGWSLGWWRAMCSCWPELGPPTLSTFLAEVVGSPLPGHNECGAGPPQDSVALGSRDILLWEMMLQSCSENDGTDDRDVLRWLTGRAWSPSDLLVLQAFHAVPQHLVEDALARLLPRNGQAVVGGRCEHTAVLRTLATCIGVRGRFPAERSAWTEDYSLLEASHPALSDIVDDGEAVSKLEQERCRCLLVDVTSVLLNAGLVLFEEVDSRNNGPYYAALVRLDKGEDRRGLAAWLRDNAWDCPAWFGKRASRPVLGRGQ